MVRVDAGIGDADADTCPIRREAGTRNLTLQASNVRHAVVEVSVDSKILLQAHHTGSLLQGGKRPRRDVAHIHDIGQNRVFIADMAPAVRGKGANGTTVGSGLQVNENADLLWWALSIKR